jgi:hypothetical protein
MAAGKPSPNKWLDIQMAIAAIAMTSVLTFWNMFAGPDREKAAEKEAARQQAQIVPTAAVAAPSILPTVPPLGYTIVFGGAAPKPQVVVQSGGGGGGGGGNGGGAVTSTSSS